MKEVWIVELRRDDVTGGVYAWVLMGIFRTRSKAQRHWHELKKGWNRPAVFRYRLWPLE